jgi:hypothetical protein
LAVHQSRYEFRTGEAANIIAPRETLDFIRKAKSRTVRIDGREARGFVYGPSVRGDGVLIAAAHTVKPVRRGLWFGVNSSEQSGT